MTEELQNGLPTVQLRRESTAENVATALHDLIVTGAIAQGTHLSEGPLSQQLGVSRNTVREALQILASQGLVRREIHRGAYVSELDADDVHDLFRVRRLIELAAVRELAAGGADVSALEKPVAAIMAASDNAEILDGERQFWHVLVELAPGERLRSLHAATANELQLSVALGDGKPLDPKRIARQLRTIINAMRKGDADRAVLAAGDRLEREARWHLARLPA